MTNLQCRVWSACRDFLSWLKLEHSAGRWKGPPNEDLSLVTLDKSLGDTKPVEPPATKQYP